MKIDRIYEMGSNHHLSPQQCSFEELAIHICKLEHCKMVKEREKKDIDETKELERINFSGTDEVKECIKRLRSQKGYIGQLKDNLNFDLNKYLSSNNNTNIAQVFKILYLVYTLKEEYGQRALGVFKNPTIEVADGDYLKTQGYCEETEYYYNSAIVSYINRELEQELDQDYIDEIRYVMEMPLLMVDLFNMTAIELMENCPSDFDKRAAQILARSMEQEWACSFVPITYDELSPVEEFYFRVLQKGCVGRVTDSMKIYHNTRNYNIPEDMIDEYRTLVNNKILFDELEQYIESNIDRLARLVYGKEHVNSAEKKRIIAQSHKVPKIVKYSMRPIEDKIPRAFQNELYLVSCLQAFLLDEDGRTAGYHINGYQSRMKHLSTPQAVLNYAEHTPEFLQRYWQRRVSDRYYSIMGKQKWRQAFEEVEYLCDMILMEILSLDSPYDIVNHGNAFKRLLDNACAKIKNYKKEEDLVFKLSPIIL